MCDSIWPFVRTSLWPVTTPIFRHVRYPLWPVTDESIEIVQYHLDDRAFILVLLSKMNFSSILAWEWLISEVLSIQFKAAQIDDLTVTFSFAPYCNSATLLKPEHSKGFTYNEPWITALIRRRIFLWPILSLPSVRWPFLVASVVAHRRLRAGAIGT